MFANTPRAAHGGDGPAAQAIREVLVAVLLAEQVGRTRQIVRMDVGGMPHAAFLKGIELLGTDVLPRSARISRSQDAATAPLRP